MNNYLANIAARTMNTDPLVRPRLSGRFEPTPPASEPGIGALNQVSSEPLLPVDALLDSPPIDETRRRRRRDIRHERTHSITKPEPPTANGAHDRDVVAIISTQVSDPISPPRSLSSRTREIKTLAEPAPLSTHFEERWIEDQRAVASIETVKPTIAEPPRRTSREESRFDEPAQLPAHRVEALEAEPVLAGVDRPMTKKTRPFPVREDEKPLIPPLERARPVIERELETDIREKSIVGEPGRGTESPAKRKDSRALPSSDEPEHPAAKVTPVAVQTLVAPKVEVVRMPPTRFDVQPQPTIHVTIGRIEIRAVQSPQPAIKSRGPTPVMNLDEYLRRRNQGNAR